MLRDKSDNHKFKKYFEQRAFSFGPYYQPYYTQNMAIQIKVILADDFLKQNGVKKEDLQIGLANWRIETYYKVFLADDLFLLKNQLLYRPLQLIIRHASKQDKLLKSIYKFIFFWFRTSEEWYKNENNILEDLSHHHVHLLDLLRKKLIQPLHQIDHERRDLKEIIIGWTVFLCNKLNRNRNDQQSI
ncbi:hypothetical protein QYF36_017537 [Acer negundo]|nr:hypothetical protein QYF36_017537 [Acer negundo]